MLCETARLLTWVSLKCRKCDWKEMQKKLRGQQNSQAKAQIFVVMKYQKQAAEHLLGGNELSGYSF